MIVANTPFEEVQEQSFEVKESSLSLRKTSDPNHPSTYALTKNTIN
jgi:hypothetical protein